MLYPACLNTTPICSLQQVVALFATTHYIAPKLAPNTATVFCSASV
jgi:hypothetical protein